MPEPEVIDITDELLRQDGGRQRHRRVADQDHYASGWADGYKAAVIACNRLLERAGVRERIDLPG